jgi:hypothetical protein
MKASEMIADLIDLIAEYGDLEMFYESAEGLSDVASIEEHRLVLQEPWPFFIIS